MDGRIEIVIPEEYYGEDASDEDYQVTHESENDDENELEDSKFGIIQMAEQMMFQDEDDSDKNKKRRPANPDTWKKNINKKLKMQGQPYETKKGIQAAKVPKEIDCRNCKFKCTNNFSEEDRRAICASFWKLDYCRKKDFILMNVKSLAPKRRRPRTGTGSPRTNSKIFHFLRKGNSVRVCQSFFTRTLNICSQSIKKAFEHKNPYTNFFEGTDSRGKHPPKNKASEDQLKTIKMILEHFPYSVVRNKTRSKKVFKDNTLSLQKLFNTYKTHCINNDEKFLSIKTFVRIFRNEFPEYSIQNSGKREPKMALIKTEPTSKKAIEEIDTNANLSIGELYVINAHGQKVVLDPNDLIEEDPDIMEEHQNEANTETIIYDPQAAVTYTSVPTFQVRLLPGQIVDSSTGQIQFY